MADFIFYAPTEVAFGRSSEQKIGAMAKKYGAHKVLLHYGGGSAVRSGLIDVVKQQLDQQGIAHVELGGVKPNPRLQLVRQGIELAREQGVDMVLAVGGGSVIDSSKAIGYGVANPEIGNVWDLFTGKAQAKACLPVGVVLTIPAAGSEMSSSCVISDDESGLKLGYQSNYSRPKFAILNPERTFTLPAWQTACGGTDIMMHTMERYFTNTPMMLTDAFAEGLLRTVLKVTPMVLKDPHNYDLRAELMWAGSMAHNDVTGERTLGDWSTHKMEHELSALYGVSHGAGLATLWPYIANYQLSHGKVERLLKFATEVTAVKQGSDDDALTASKGIDAMVDFYHTIGMPTSIPQLIGRKATDDEIAEMANRCTKRGTKTVGGYLPLDREAVALIYHQANGDDTHTARYAK